MSCGITLDGPDIVRYGEPTIAQDQDHAKVPRVVGDLVASAKYVQHVLERTAQDHAATDRVATGLHLTDLLDEGAADVRRGGAIARGDNEWNAVLGKNDD